MREGGFPEENQRLSPEGRLVLGKQKQVRAGQPVSQLLRVG